ncbi:MAG TPA: NAAT family transporter [Candidatus Omnitrophota bacterium]|nr:NAAT family transporter [Candidatus Omnitrophota bacterium]
MDFAILCFTSLFAIVDPIGIIPAFLAITPGKSAQDRVRISAMASVLTFFILVLFAFLGRQILGALSVTLPAFEIAGGILLFFIAMDMLNARMTHVKQTREEQDAGADKTDIAITPLAIPMLAGPGAITAVMILASRVSGLGQGIILLGAIFLVSAITFLVFYVVAVKSSLISVILQKIFTRLMGLLLAAIAIQFILNGIAASGLL